MRERLMFGSVKTFEQAVFRLPPPDHPRLKKKGPDEDLSNLSALRQTILTSTPATSLKRRMVPLTCEDVYLMRDILTLGPVLLEREWSRFDDRKKGNSPWGEIYFLNDDVYFGWRVLEMLPRIDSPDFSLVCIRTTANLFDDTSPPPEFDIGLVSMEELALLKEGLAY